MSRRPRLHALAYAIDADRAADVEARLSPALGAGSEALSIAVLLAAAHPALGSAIEAAPQVARDLAIEGFVAPRRREDLLERLRAAVGPEPDEPRVRQALRRFAHAERARIALRELVPISQGGADVDVTARELAYLAEATIQVALDEAFAAVTARYGRPLTANGAPSRFVVLGMGKLGGLELNPGSDVDLIYLYDTDDGEARPEPDSSQTRAPTSLHDVWTRVARRLTATLEDVTEDGFVWRVDLRLRPEGRSGPLVNSLAAAERYYEAFGRLWERAALLRARPVAGALDLGDEVEEALSPFVWRRRVDPALAVELARLTERARAELSHDARRDLKLGPGGIREAELFVQTLQLVWGGREPVLREKGTLAALRRLRAAGLVTDREGRDIEGAYLALRRAEHAVQSATGVQTHLRPEHPAELARLAHALGFADSPAFLTDLARHTRRVAACFASLRPADAATRSRWIEALAALERRNLDGFVEAFARVAEVAELAGGAAQPPSGEADRAIAEQWFDVARDVFDLARTPDAPLGDRSREAFPALAESLLDAVVDAADPAQAARYLRTFFGRVRRPGIYVRLLADEPRAVRRLCTVLGASAFLGDAVVGNPELGDLVLFAGAPPTPASACAELALEIERAGGVAAVGDGDDPDDGFVGALRRAKARVTVAVGLADLAEEVSLRDATRTLSAFAEATLEAATKRALGTLPGEPARGLAVIAMGKLGGQELGHGSDLDVLFFFDPAAAPSGSDPVAYFTRAARRVIRLISISHPAGPGYELDTRLRPSGTQGLLVASLDGFARYHGVGVDGRDVEQEPSTSRARAAAWERVALLRARAVAGDVALGEAAIRIAHATAYDARGEPELVTREIRHLRSRMERELSQERKGRRDPKLGRGGLIEVELAVQLLQMRHGVDPAVRTTETLTALEALETGGYVAAAEAEALRDGYAFLRKLEQRIRIVHGDTSEVIDERAPGLVPLARRMGIRERPRAEAAVELLARYGAVTERVRSAYETIVGLASE